MITFKDFTFCASPNCKNECDRKLSGEDKKLYEFLNRPDDWDGKLPISYGYFCGEEDICSQ
jgi:hypothetical protein